MTRPDKDVRRGTGVPVPLLIVLATVVGLDMAMYSVVGPLLPGLQREIGMSNSTAGLVVAAYPFGLMVFAVPAGVLVGRWGPRRTLIVGALSLGATSVAFGLASSAEWLITARALQGVSSAVSWAAALTWLVGAAPRDRQGLAIGTAMSAAGAGAVGGPTLGVLAVLVGRDVVSGAIGAIALGVAVVLTRHQAPKSRLDAGVWKTASQLVSSTGVVFLVVVMLCACSLGMVAVLVPLRLDDVGAASTLIGVILLGVAVIEVVAAPLVGRLVDRVGPRRPLVCLLLLTTSCVLLPRFDSAVVAGAVVLLCVPAMGLLYTPALVGLTELVQARSLSMAGLVGLSNLLFALGEGVGALSAGWLEDRNTAASGLIGLAVLSGAISLVVVRGLRGSTSSA